MNAKPDRYQRLSRFKNGVPVLVFLAADYERRREYAERQEIKPLSIMANRYIHMGSVICMAVITEDVIDLRSPCRVQQREQASPRCTKQFLYSSFGLVSTG